MESFTLGNESYLNTEVKLPRTFQGPLFKFSGTFCRDIKDKKVANHVN